MSTALHDLPTAAAAGLSFMPGTLSASGNGDAVDLGDGDGPATAVLMVGAVSPGGTVDAAVEESANGTAWVPVTGATFPQTTVENVVRLIRFTRSRRLVRVAVTLGGSSPEVGLAALFVQQKKVT